MFEDSLELAENKLILIYIINKLKCPLTKNQLTQIILENNLMNYFILQQYICELVSSGIIKYSKNDTDHNLLLTDKGIKVLNLFKNRIHPDKLKSLDEYLNKNYDIISRKITVTADYTVEHGKYMVSLKSYESNDLTASIKIKAADIKQAKNICSKWKNNSSNICKEIMQILTNG